MKQILYIIMFLLLLINSGCLNGQEARSDNQPKIENTSQNDIEQNQPVDHQDKESIVVTRAYQFEGSIIKSEVSNGVLKAITFQPQQYIQGSSPLDTSPIDMKKPISLKVNEPITDEELKHIQINQKVKILINGCIEKDDKSKTIFWVTGLNQSFYQDENGKYQPIKSDDTIK